MIARRRPPTWRGFAPGILAGLGLAWLLCGGSTTGALQAQATPGPAANGTFAFTSATPGSPAAQLLYLVDTRTQSLAVYRVDPQDPKGALKLEATRQYQWDLKLGEFNNQPPEVSAVEGMVGNVRR